MNPMKYTMVAAASAVVAGTMLTGCGNDKEGRILHGNVDDRELQLSFVINERLSRVIPEEGTFVRKGELIAELETVRIENEIAVQKALVAVDEAKLMAAQAAMDKSDNGSRAEDIQKSRDLIVGYTSKMQAALVERDRNAKLVKTGAVSKQQYDDSVAKYEFIAGELGAETNRLAMLIEGDRAEDRAATRANLAEAKGMLQKAKADLAVAEQKRKDSFLYAPADGVIRERLLEPGEWTSQFKPAFVFALTDPKWVRCYLRETQLAAYKLDHKCKVLLDGRDQPLEGWIGYISPTAEFTPKNIETDELRPTLVYETRVYVKDPEGVLKLGAPVVVEL